MSTEKFATLASKIKHVREVHRINKAEFARRLGISRAYASEIESGRKSHVSPMLASMIEREFGLNEGWLTIGDGEPFFDRVPGISAFDVPAAIPRAALARLVSGDYTFIPLFDVRAAAGPGAWVETEEIIDVLVLNTKWLRTHLRVDPANLAFLHVEGDSMTPTIQPNELILVDRSAAGRPGDGIYLIRMNDHLFVKRLQIKLVAKRVRIVSDNPAYQPEELDLLDMEGADFAVLGRVVWSGKSV